MNNKSYIEIEGLAMSDDPGIDGAMFNFRKFTFVNKTDPTKKIIIENNFYDTKLLKAVEDYVLVGEDVDRQYKYTISTGYRSEQFKIKFENVYDLNDLYTIGKEIQENFKFEDVEVICNTKEPITYDFLFLLNLVDPETCFYCCCAPDHICNNKSTCINEV